MVELINSFPDFSGSFGDKRIEKRAAQALQKLTAGRSSSIRRVTTTEAEQKSFYRLFNNENFNEQSIEQSIVGRCGQLCKGRHVLCIQDTTEFNFSGQAGRIKAKSGLGKTTKEGILGFMLHSSLVIDANIGSALGYSYIKAWEREEDVPDRHQRKYKQLPIEEKESYKWIAALNQSKTILQQATSITVIADRESDIYDLLSTASEQEVNLVIRSNANRQIKQGGKLVDYLDGLPVMHQYNLQVRGDVRKSIEKRTAIMELKWGKAALVNPGRNKKTKDLPPTQELYVVEAKEQNKSKGIYWRLLTSHCVSNAEEAMQIIEWYKHRWYIEQMHRLLKTEGLRLESSQLEQGWAIRKLTLLSMMAVLRILQMMLAYEDDHEQPIDEVFDKEEQQCLQMINKKVEGETEKLKNTCKPNTLKWATWIIARLGGWKGYTSSSQRKPGPIVLQKGLAKFYHMYEGWQIYQKFSKDVSSQ